MTTIDNLPTFDQLKLRTIQGNAQRLLAKGSPAEKAQALAMLAAIDIEFDQRHRTQNSVPAVPADPLFDALWLRILQSLAAGDSVRNWSADRGFTGDGFNIEEVAPTYVRVFGGGMKASRAVSKTDFANIFRVWPDYRAARYSRGDLGRLSQNTTYIISILYRVDAPRS